MHFTKMQWEWNEQKFLVKGYEKCYIRFAALIFLLNYLIKYSEDIKGFVITYKLCGNRFCILPNLPLNLPNKYFFL